MTFEIFNFSINLSGTYTYCTLIFKAENTIISFRLSIVVFRLNKNNNIFILFYTQSIVYFAFF